MQSAVIKHLPVQRSLDLTEYETEFEPEYGILWGFLNPQAGPIASIKLLEDVRKHDRLFESNGGRVFYEGEHRPVNYYVSGSRIKGVYNLGGDLAYFMECVERTLGGVPFLRIIHGHGTGKLKASLRVYLKGSPYVAEFRAGDRSEGGDGVTIVRLSS